MPSTSRLGIVYVEQAQSQKEVSVNAGFDVIDDAAVATKTLVLGGTGMHADGFNPVETLPYGYDGSTRNFVLKAVRFRTELAVGSSLDIELFHNSGSGAIGTTSVFSSTFSMASGQREAARTTGFSATSFSSGHKFQFTLPDEWFTGMVSWQLVFEETF